MQFLFNGGHGRVRRGEMEMSTYWFRIEQCKTIMQTTKEKTPRSYCHIPYNIYPLYISMARTTLILKACNSY